jgi:hypothetical protein
MSDESVSDADLEALEKRLAAAVGGARSLDEIKAWLKSQPHVKSVELADYLLKSHPPQRDFIVELKAEGGTTIRKIVNVYDLGKQQFRFNKLRDQ